jgi:hypothetical protein
MPKSKNRTVAEELEPSKPQPPKVNLQVDDLWLIRLDRWRLQQGLPVLSRSEAIRRTMTELFDRDGISSEVSETKSRPQGKRS